MSTTSDSTSEGGETEASSDGSTTNASEPTTGGPAPVPGREICERYIGCVAVTTPAGLPDAQAGFGDDSPCWSKGQDEADLCIVACQAGLEQAHAAFPEAVECDLCLADEECAAGERCLQGDCKTGNCGDGIVDPEELCDGQPECGQDCVSGPSCTPLTDLGCLPGDKCIINPEASGALCVEHPQADEIIVGHGEGCGWDLGTGQIYACDHGLWCVEEGAGDFNCSLGACCSELCDLGAPVCPDGQECVALAAEFTAAEPALGYLGACVP